MEQLVFLSSFPYAICTETFVLFSSSIILYELYANVQPFDKMSPPTASYLFYPRQIHLNVIVLSRLQSELAECFFISFHFCLAKYVDGCKECHSFSHDKIVFLLACLTSQSTFFLTPRKNLLWNWHILNIYFIKDMGTCILTPLAFCSHLVTDGLADWHHNILPFI